MTTVIFHSPMHDIKPWRAALAACWVDMPLLELEEAGRLQDDCYAIVLYPPKGALARLKNLRAILSIAAGVDHILADPTTPDVPIYRQTDESLQQTMIEFALMAALMLHRNMPDYIARQKKAHWEMILPLKLAKERHVGILGLGNLGSVIATSLAQFGFRVHGWARSEKSLQDAHCYHGEAGLQAMLPKIDILINVLPLTPQTRKIINGALMNRLPRGAGVVNIGRGEHLVEDDLLKALDAGQLSAAILDVVSTEPLSSEHPLWHHDKVILTPHIAGDILMTTAIPHTLRHLKTLLEGGSPPGFFNRTLGY